MPNSILMNDRRHTPAELSEIRDHAERMAKKCRDFAVGSSLKAEYLLAAERWDSVRAASAAALAEVAS